MKQIIRKILKESNVEKFAHFILSKTKGMSSPDVDLFKTKMGMTPELHEYFNGKFYRKLEQLIGDEIDIEDCPTCIGNYGFTFTINSFSVNSEPYITGDPDYVLVEVTLNGSVSLYDSLEDEMVLWDINKARNSYDGWEIEGEISDIVYDILGDTIPEFNLSNIDVEFWYK